MVALGFRIHASIKNSDQIPGLQRRKRAVTLEDRRDTGVSDQIGRCVNGVLHPLGCDHHVDIAKQVDLGQVVGGTVDVDPGHSKIVRPFHKPHRRQEHARIADDVATGLHPQLRHGGAFHIEYLQKCVAHRSSIGLDRIGIAQLSRGLWVSLARPAAAQIDHHRRKPGLLVQGSHDARQFAADGCEHRRIGRGAADMGVIAEHLQMRMPL